MAVADPAQKTETPADFGTGPGAQARRWISEITLALKGSEQWRQRCRKVIEQYADSQKAESKSRRFALFWSNIETLKPATLARVPSPVVSRRYKDEDPTGRIASEVLERALSLQMDVTDLAECLTGVRDDLLLVAKGTAWVRYVPHMETREPDGDVETKTPTGQVSDGAEPYEVVAWEEAVPDHVNWQDFLHSPGREWSEVRWVARRAFMTRPELIARFGEEKGKAVPLDHAPEDYSGPDDEKEQWKKGVVWELWDKPSRKAIWVCTSCPDYLLDERDDPLGLQDFFPCPRPVIGTKGTDNLNTTPDYIYYQVQCKDIDELTARIGKLTDALKLKGFFAAGNEVGKTLKDLFSSENTTLIPVDSWAAFAERGGVKGLIEWLPLDMVASTITSCIEARKQLIEDVYQVTGISDIMRGDVDPDETATATRSKANWGSSRVRDKQKELARFARDLVRIMGQVIATKFSPDTLAEMTNVQLFRTPEEKQAAMQQLQARAQQAAQLAQQAQAMGQPPPAPFQPPAQVAAMLQRPTWQEVCQVLQSNTLRTFRIDIETDSTIEPNDQEEKQRRVEFVTAIGEYVAKSLPAIQLAPQLLPVIIEGLKFLVRGFRVGREMEEVIDKALDQLNQAGGMQAPQQQGQQSDPQAEQAKAQADQTNAQANMVKAQAAQGHLRVEAAKVQSQHQIGMAQVQAENIRSEADRHAEAQMTGVQLMHDAAQKALERQAVKEMSDQKPMRADTA